MMNKDRTILLTISYDGTSFFGWQKQATTDNTVQGWIEKALTIIHKQPTPLFGAGRTDSGVHAQGQAAHFTTVQQSMQPPQYVLALNSLLPKTIRIVAAKEVSPLLHARFSAYARRYRYFISCKKREFAHILPYVWNIRTPLSLAQCNRLAQQLHGEQDFTTFCAASDQSISKKRYIYHAYFSIESEKIVFDICANAFLQKMVRSLVGTLVFCAREGYSPQDFKQILDAKDRHYAKETAPASGLFLWSVKYPPYLLSP